MIKMWEHYFFHYITDVIVKCSFYRIPKRSTSYLSRCISASKLRLKFTQYEVESCSWVCLKSLNKSLPQLCCLMDCRKRRGRILEGKRLGLRVPLFLFSFTHAILQKTLRFSWSISRRKCQRTFATQVKLNNNFSRANRR